MNRVLSLSLSLSLSISKLPLLVWGFLPCDFSDDLCSASVTGVKRVCPKVTPEIGLYIKISLVTLFG